MKNILVKIEGNLGVIQFNSSDRLNTLSSEMLRELEKAIELLSHNDEIKVVVIRGNKTAFTIGGDMHEHKLELQEETVNLLEFGNRLLEKIRKLDAITIAAVEGKVIGGGCELISSCDFCFASEKANFRYIQVRYGITTAWGGASRLIKKIGFAQALPILLTGEKIYGKKAKEIGYVDYLVAENQFESELQRLIKKFVRAPKDIIKFYKQIDRQLANGEKVSNLCSYESEMCLQLWKTETHKKAIISYFKRRS